MKDTQITKIPPIKDTQITKHTDKRYFFFLHITFYYLYLQSNP